MSYHHIIFVFHKFYMVYRLALDVESVIQVRARRADSNNRSSFFYCFTPNFRSFAKKSVFRRALVKVLMLLRNSGLIKNVPSLTLIYWLVPQFLDFLLPHCSHIFAKHIRGLVPVWYQLESCFMACSSFFYGKNIRNSKVQSQNHFLEDWKMLASCWKMSMQCLWFSWVWYQLVLYGFLITLRFQMLFLNTGRFFGNLYKCFRNVVPFSNILNTPKNLRKNDWSGNSWNVYAWDCCRSYFSSNLRIFIEEGRSQGCPDQTAYILIQFRGSPI